MSPDPVARSTIRVRVCGLIQRRMKFRTRRWLPNHRLSCRIRFRSRSNSAETGCGRSIISNTAGSKLRFILYSGALRAPKRVSRLTANPGSTPLTPPRVEIRGHAPIVSRTEGAVSQWEFGCPLVAEQIASAMSMNLVKRVPNTMQKVPDDEHHWQSNTKEAQHSEYNRTSGFELPCVFLPEVSRKRQIESRDRN